MAENYSGNIKIKEKPFMQKRQKIILRKLFRFKISEDKTNPLSKFTKPTKLRTKIGPLKNCKLNKISGKFPHLQICCKPVVQPIDVSHMTC
jgi:hypothetical protein